MHYTFLAMIGMASYGVTMVLLKSAMRTIPPEVALVVTNTILVLGGVVYMVYRSTGFTEYLTLGRPVLLIGLAGLTLTVGIVSYYTALSRGPAVVVVPIFAMNFAVASVLGMIFLEEGIKAYRSKAR